MASAPPDTCKAPSPRPLLPSVPFVLLSSPLVSSLLFSSHHSRHTSPRQVSPLRRCRASPPTSSSSTRPSSPAFDAAAPRGLAPGGCAIRGGGGGGCLAFPFLPAFPIPLPPRGLSHKVGAPTLMAMIDSLRPSSPRACVAVRASCSGGPAEITPSSEQRAADRPYML